MRRAKNAEELLAGHGLTRLEWDAMSDLSHPLFLSLDGLALSAASNLTIRDRCNPQSQSVTADMYREALLGLMRKGWLKLAAEPRESRVMRAEARGIRLPPMYRLAEVGYMDFTTRGYKWYRQVERSVYPHFVEPERLIWTDETTGTVSCIAGAKQACYDWLDETRDPDSSGFWDLPRSKRRVGIEGPVQVGAWKSREAAAIHSCGWQLSVLVKQVRRRQLRLPLWNAEGEITPGESLTIVGTVGEVRFRLSDGVREFCEGRHAPLSRFKARLTIYDGEYEEREESIFTILDGVETLACTMGNCRDTHFHWQEATYPERTKQLTIPEAVASLQEGFVAWKQARSLCYNSATRQKEIDEDNWIFER